MKTKNTYRKYGKKKQFGRKKKVYNGIHNIVLNPMNQKGFLKMRGYDPVIHVDQSSTYCFQYSLTRPDLYLSMNGGAFNGAVKDWNYMAEIYDQYRVVGIKFTIVPHFIATEDRNLTLYTGQLGLQPIMSYLDIDQIAATATSVANAVEYDTLRYFPREKISTMYVRVPKYSSTSNVNGYMDTNSAAHYGSIFFVFPALSSLTTNISEATITCEYYVKFLGRK